ncbi:uncharacterized protein LOC131027146 [Cryptomeria japonica]|uniref:uncharacterized protein LOC131027146 n=1 Tax=Cryptomeria japonica TaxID=3369 RepID=UPI0025AB8960|nr:uncharacterized protein LOC131027146 [Cryptomeria japonica]
MEVKAQDLRMGDSEIEQEARDVATVQIRQQTIHIPEGLMRLVKKCLLSEEDTRESFSVICGGHVNHFQAESFDELWGCGWRNIQILSSHLIEKEEMKDVLFGGASFVPCILALQKWLELGWRKGFDVQGAQEFGWNIIGTCKWIGSTECAALFRSFGLRANIVEFKCHSSASAQYNHHSEEENSDYPFGRDNEIYARHRHKVMIDWIWRYFLCGYKESESAGDKHNNRVMISNRSVSLRMCYTFRKGFKDYNKM